MKCPGKSLQDSYFEESDLLITFTEQNLSDVMYEIGMTKCICLSAQWSTMRTLAVISSLLTPVYRLQTDHQYLMV